MCKSSMGPPWIPIRDPMWGRSGPSMDPYKDPIWMPLSGSSGPVAGGHGSVEMENGALAYGANVVYIKPSIVYFKYV